jgi:hypothetical protein
MCYEQSENEYIYSWCSDNNRMSTIKKGFDQKLKLKSQKKVMIAGTVTLHILMCSPLGTHHNKRMLCVTTSSFIKYKEYTKINCYFNTFHRKQI